MNESYIVNNVFLEKLPYDIISYISYLDQEDARFCMSLCREWYHRIPQFTHAKWKTLRLDQKGISPFQKRNLGKHVKYVLFQDVEADLLSKMMQKLLDYECTEIESLGKYYIEKKR